MFFVA